MIGSKYLNQMGIIRKKIKVPIFSKKKKVSSYHGSLVIKNKNVFFLNAHNSLMMLSSFKM